MLFTIDIPDEMIGCGAVEGIEICFNEQVDAICEHIEEELTIAEEELAMAEDEECIR